MRVEQGLDSDEWQHACCCIKNTGFMQGDMQRAVA